MHPIAAGSGFSENLGGFEFVCSAADWQRYIAFYRGLIWRHSEYSRRTIYPLRYLKEGRSQRVKFATHPNNSDATKEGYEA